MDGSCFLNAYVTIVNWYVTVSGDLIHRNQKKLKELFNFGILIDTKCVINQAKYIQ